jgi:hypothetical protein
VLQAAPGVAPAHARASVWSSASAQLEDENGGVVTEDGLQPE